MNAIIAALHKKVWITRSTRFITYNRLKSRASLSNITINCVSSYIAAISVLSLSCSVQKPVSIDATIAGLSLVLTAIVFFESSQNYQLRAHNFHRHTLELSNIYNEIDLYLKLNTNYDSLKIIELTNKYQNIINSFDENHSTLDHKLFYADKWNELIKPNIGLCFFSILFSYISSVILVRSIYFINYKLIYYLGISCPVIYFFYLVRTGVFKF